MSCSRGGKGNADSQGSPSTPASGGSLEANLFLETISGNAKPPPEPPIPQPFLGLLESPGATVTSGLRGQLPGAPAGELWVQQYVLDATQERPLTLKIECVCKYSPASEAGAGLPRNAVWWGRLVSRSRTQLQAPAQKCTLHSVLPAQGTLSACPAPGRSWLPFDITGTLDPRKPDLL